MKPYESAEIDRLSNGARSAPMDKNIADGFCDVCSKSIPVNHPNKFYCCEECRQAAYNYFLESLEQNCRD